MPRRRSTGCTPCAATSATRWPTSTMPAARAAPAHRPGALAARTLAPARRGLPRGRPVPQPERGRGPAGAAEPPLSDPRAALAVRAAVMHAAAPRHFSPGAGLPGDRGARSAARRAFVELKLDFLHALAGVPAADWLHAQVRSAEEPVDLWLLRAPVFAALAGVRSRLPPAPPATAPRPRHDLPRPRRGERLRAVLKRRGARLRT